MLSAKLQTGQGRDSLGTRNLQAQTGHVCYQKIQIQHRYNKQAAQELWIHLPGETEANVVTDTSWLT